MKSKPLARSLAARVWAEEAAARADRVLDGLPEPSTIQWADAGSVLWLTWNVSDTRRIIVLVRALDIIVRVVADMDETFSWSQDRVYERPHAVRNHVAKLLEIRNTL